MTFQQIKYLLEIYRTGSIAKAASNLFLVPSSVSIAIGNLEEELGCQIFTRTQKGMIPTDRGLEIIEYANKIYANYQLMTAAPQKERRRITLATVNYSAVNNAFVRLVAENQDRTDVSFSKVHLPYSQVASQIASFELDLGILLHNEARYLSVESSLLAKGLRPRVLGRLPRVITIGPGHPLYDKQDIDHRDFAQDTLIDRQDGYTINSDFLGGFLQMQRERTLFVNDEATRLQLLSQGLGYTIGLPTPPEITKLYGLRHIPLEHLPFVLVALDNPARPTPPEISRFLTLLENELHCHSEEAPADEESPS